jgi:molybdopterin-guanine dinucleotide biosynthesis protein A
MPTGIILAGGESTRMPGDKAFMEVAGRRVIDIQIEVMHGLFEEILIVANTDRVGALAVFEGEGVEVVEEAVRGFGPLGGILSGLAASRSDEVFIVACDLPFINREGVTFVMESLKGFQVAVPCTPDGLEPLHAAYHWSCRPFIEEQLDSGDLKVTRFFDRVSVNEIPWEELGRFDPTGRMLFNINSPADMRTAADACASERGRAPRR